MIDDPHGPLYTVFCTDASTTANWQAELLEHSWVRADMSGRLIRVVAVSGDEPVPQHQSAHVRPMVAAGAHPRLHALAGWIDVDRPVGTVLLIEPTMVFRSPLDHRSEPGAVVAQPSSAATSPARLPQADAITWPLLVHTSDLREAIEPWLVRDKEQGGEAESDGSFAGGRDALSSRVAQTAAHITPRVLALRPVPGDSAAADAPLIDYSQPIVDPTGAVVWDPRTYRPWEHPRLEGVDLSDEKVGSSQEFLALLTRFAALRRAAATFTAD